MKTHCISSKINSRLSVSPYARSTTGHWQTTIIKYSEMENL